MELFKYDFFNIIKKKRFIVMIGLVLLGALGMTIYTKVKFWNDQTFFFAMYNYIFYVSSWVPVAAIIISIYQKKFTKNAILLVEEHGKKRASGVMSKFFAGALTIICVNLIIMLWILLLGLCFGAHSTWEQIWMLALRIGMDCVAGIACYSSALFLMFIFAFPVIPLLYLVFMVFVSVFFYYTRAYGVDGYVFAVFLDPKLTSDVTYTQLLFFDSELVLPILFLIFTVIPLLLSIPVFCFKKKERKRKHFRKSESAEC